MNYFQAKQLARQAAAALNKSKSNSPTQPPNSNTDTTPTSDNNDYTSSDLSGGGHTNEKPNEETSPLSPENTNPTEQLAELTVSSQQQPTSSPFKNIVTPARNGSAANSSEETFSRLPFTPITAASLAASTLSPAPILGITQLSSPSTIAAISVGSGGAVLATPGGTTTIIEAPEGNFLYLQEKSIKSAEF